MTLGEYWESEGGQVVFGDFSGTVTVFRNDEPIAIVPQWDFPLTSRDFACEVVLVPSGRGDYMPVFPNEIN